MSESFLVNTSVIEHKINMALDKVRPYIQSHGGDVEVSGIASGVLTLRIKGTCAHCPLANLTYNKVVKTLLGEEVPEITEVILS